MALILEDSESPHAVTVHDKEHIEGVFDSISKRPDLVLGRVRSGCYHPDDAQIACELLQSAGTGQGSELILIGVARR